MPSVDKVGKVNISERSRRQCFDFFCKSTFLIEKVIKYVKMGKEKQEDVSRPFKLYVSKL